MQMNFRSSINGFNRDDVVHYIEYLNTKHTAEINQMNSELDYLRTQQPATVSSDLEETIAQQASRIRELFDRCKQLEQELADAQEEKALLIQQNEQITAARAATPAIPAPVSASAAYRSRAEDELEAYRQAERAERLARERAELLCRQANSALADATIKVDDAARQVSQMSDRVISQLTELQNAVAGSKQALRDAAATMYTIRPYED